MTITTNLDELADQIYQLEKQLNMFDEESQSIIKRELDHLYAVYEIVGK